MKIDLFREKYLDLLIIDTNNLSYFKIFKEKTKTKVLKSEKIEINIFSRGIFYFSNLEVALQSILKKYKLTELGVVLNLPNIIFQKINLAREIGAKEAIVNYLKTFLPLPIEKYYFFYKEDKYRGSPTLATFNVFLISKEIIESILNIIEKNNLIPIFISPSIEISFQYFINKNILNFDEDYLIFLLEENTLLVFLISNFRLEKVILEEYNSEKISLDLLISRVYDFLKPLIKTTTKIIFFMKERDFPEITQEKIFYPTPPIDVFIEGGYYTFLNVLREKQIIDFSPLKNYTAYFLNRLPSIIIFLSVYILILTLGISISYFAFQNKFKKEIKTLSSEIKNISSNENIQIQLENFKNVVSQLNSDFLSKFYTLEKIKDLPGFEFFNLSSEGLIFSLKTEIKEIEKIKFQVSQNFPQAKLIEENTFEDKVILKYSF